MMKTKLTLFVAVLAATLFMGGCASVPKPDVPKPNVPEPDVANAVKWNGHWYAVLPPADWDTAKQKCGQLGGHLAYAESSAENEFLVKLVHDSHEGDEGLLNAPIKAWLGGTDHKDEGEWVWLNNKPITKFFWAKSPNQPDNAGAEHYLEFRWRKGTVEHPTGGWNDIEREVINVVVCEWE